MLFPIPSEWTTTKMKDGQCWSQPIAEIDNDDVDNGNTVEKRWIMQMSELRKWQSLWQSPNPKLSSSFACPYCHGHIPKEKI